MLLLGVLVMGLTFAAGAARLGVVLVARAHADGAADAAALAAADELALGGSDADARAAAVRSAARNDAVLVRCECEGLEASVVLEVDVPGLALGGRARGHAKAEVRPECVLSACS
jgi:hypothetical protein